MAAVLRDPKLAVRRYQDHWRGDFAAMASPCQVLSRAADRGAAQLQLEAAAAEAWRIEAKFSRYRDGNVVHRINSADGAAVEVDEETANLIDFAATLYELCERRFDITSGVLREVWTFDGSDRIPGADEVRRVLERVGWHKAVWRRPVLTLAPGMQIDLGGIGKEYAVDRAAALAAAHSDAPCLVNFGGDIAACGEAALGTPWRVGIEAIGAGTGAAFKRIRLERGGARHQRRRQAVPAERRRALQPPAESRYRLAGTRCAPLGYGRCRYLHAGRHAVDAGDADGCRRRELPGGASRPLLVYTLTEERH